MDLASELSLGKDSVSELQEYKRGVLEGEVKVFNKDQRLVRAYHMKDELKHGEEIHYHMTVYPRFLPLSCL